MPANTIQPKEPALGGARPFAPNAVAGLLCAVVTIAYAASFASLVFGGALAPYSGGAMSAAVISSVVALIALSFLSSVPIALGGPDSNPSAILAITLAALARSIASESGGASRLLPTVLTFVFLSAFLCGAVLYGLGARKWGRYVRYIPYPVIGGFLAGTGYLLLSGGFFMIVGGRLGAVPWRSLAEIGPFAYGTAAAVALMLTVLSRVWRHYLVIPGALIVSIALFYVALAAAHYSLAYARRLGLLIEPIRLSDWTYVLNIPWNSVEWGLLLAHGKDFIVMTMVVAITSLLNATSLELATGYDTDFDQELRAVGVGNMISGLGGGMVAVNSFNRTLLNLKAGANSRWAARIAAAIVFALALLAPGTVALLPKPVLAGLVVYIGISLLLTWLWDSRRIMPRSDYIIVMAILGIVVLMGIVPGVILGIVIACLSFIIALSRTPTIKYRFTAANRHSNVDRTAGQMQWLRRNGSSLQGFVLQGFLFFGTSNDFLEEIRKVHPAPRYLVLDLWLIQGLDATWAVVLKKIHSACRDAGQEFVLTGISESVARSLLRADFNLEDRGIRTFPDLDRGLEWCEDRMIEKSVEREQLSRTFGGLFGDDDIAILIRHFKRVEVASGEKIAGQGQPSDALFVIERGRVGISFRVGPGAGASGFIKRLRTYGAGTVVGEMGFYTGEPRSADIVADEATRVFRLDREALADLEKSQPEIAQSLHRFVIRTLAQRLRSANDEIGLLL